MTRVRTLFVTLVVALCACEGDRAFKPDVSLPGTWSYAVSGTGYADVLELVAGGFLDWQHSLDTLVLSSGGGAWHGSEGTLTVVHTYTRDDVTGEARYVGPYAVVGDTACMLVCHPFRLVGDTLLREVRMTDTVGRGPIRLDAGDVTLERSYVMLPGGDCSVTDRRTLRPSPGATPDEDTTIVSHSCIFERNPGSFAFSIVWEEGEYPESNLLLEFGGAWVLEGEFPLAWTRAPGP